MKETFITTLRDTRSTLEEFRRASEQLASILAVESRIYLSTEEIKVETPLASTNGSRFKKNPVLIPVLRSGLAMLGPFLKLYSSSPVGFIGIRRDEQTALPELYHWKTPCLNPDDTVFILDPMIATGGSASLAVHLLKEAGILESRIILIGFIAAPEGILHLQSKYPDLNLLIAQTDEKLNVNKYIVPGLGDFGDRYFGSV